MDVSIIFATHNRQSVLPDVFQAWREAGRAARYTFEIICSDDASADHTVDVIRSMKIIDGLRNRKGQRKASLTKLRF